MDLPKPRVRQVVITASAGANLRSAPSFAGAVLWTAPKGTVLQVGREDGIWLRVMTPDAHRAGWMHRSVVPD
jgi:SH3-like domain-containing protein